MPQDSKTENQTFDLFVIGGGINGCGIARDAAGRGLNVGLAEMNDFGSATSSASTKLFHGGLRYLEYFEIKLVRKALIERELLLRAMPHISWPMRFVLPYHKDMRFENDTPTSKLLSTVMPWMKGRRPAWLIRLGLFLYDNLGGRKILPKTSTIDLSKSPEGASLKAKFKKAYEYSDCWVEDARLVILNARDAKARGATIMPRTKVISATRNKDLWDIVTETNGETRTRHAKMIANAAGPWVEDIIKDKIRLNSTEGVRLVRGSHIVTKRLFEHDKCYIFQGTDGRIVFAIPYETDFTLIGTTDAEHSDPDEKPTCSPEESDYLRKFASEYFETPIEKEDVLWTYSGVRPLFDDGAETAAATTREYVLKVNDAGPPLLNVFGGKITTFRKLAESAMEKVQDYVPFEKADWTAGVPLPGGDFPVDGVARLTSKLKVTYPFLGDRWATRMIKAYGTDAEKILGNAQKETDLGRAFGATLTEREVDWLMANEWVQIAEDLVWRRSKLGLRMSEEEIKALDAYIASKP